MSTQTVSTKAVVTVSEMARMCSLSRARFYQLVRAMVFPEPVYCVSNRRPVYVEELQKVCLEVRRRNCGVNGRPVLFYARGHRPPAPPRPTRPAKAKPPQVAPHADLIDGLAALGTTATADQVGAAIRAVYPSGVGGAEPGEVLRAVFLHLKRQNSGDNVGR
jgi:hypothetical protein